MTSARTLDGQPEAARKRSVGIRGGQLDCRGRGRESARPRHPLVYLRRLGCASRTNRDQGPSDLGAARAASRLRTARPLGPVAGFPSNTSWIRVGPQRRAGRPRQRRTPSLLPARRLVKRRRRLHRAAPRNRGSSASRSASPSMLNPKTASEIATPGHTAIHGARNMYVRPEPESIPPHDGKGGGTPKPRNESDDSARIVAPSAIGARMMIVAMTLGRMWRTMMRAWPQPSARAASTYVDWATAIAAPRITRELIAAMRMASATTRLRSPGPRTAMTERTITRYGKDSHATTSRWITRS